MSRAITKYADDVRSRCEWGGVDHRSRVSFILLIVCRFPLANCATSVPRRIFNLCAVSPRLIAGKCSDSTTWRFLSARMNDWIPAKWPGEYGRSGDQCDG
jgi:hypothetical protein